MSGRTDSVVLVLSPLNAIISDQIQKLKSRGIRVRVFKHRLKEIVPAVDDTVKFVYFTYGMSFPTGSFCCTNLFPITCHLSLGTTVAHKVSTF